MISQGSFLHLLTLVGLTATSNAQGGLPASIVGFEPLTDVRDQNRIDLDQKSINDLLEAGDFDNASLMYEKGSHSKSVSKLTVTDGLPISITQGANITGTNEAGESVRLFAQGSNYTEGATEINVQYKDEGCYVGASVEPVTTGCLAATGTITLDDETSISYTYDPSTTFNAYNIKGFTQGTEYVFAEGDPFTVDFQKFVTFYGSETYADDIIQAAISGSSTSFSTGKDVDASQFGDIGRSEIFMKASAYMAVWMYVIRELEHAIYLCKTGDCAEESCLGKAAVHEVDEAVAFYAGSLAPDGVLTFNLIEKRAAEFSTTVSDGTSATSRSSSEATALANVALLAAFNTAKETVVGADCDGLRTVTDRIVQLMSIPLVQATLKYTASGPDGPEDEIAERVIYAASVLPLVAACSEADADIIYENTRAGATEIDLEAVKTAFANNYECMGITAEDVGEFIGEASSSDDAGETTETAEGGNSTATTDGAKSGTRGAIQAGWILGFTSLFYALF